MNDTFFNQNLAQASNLLEKGNIDRAINIFNVLSTKFPKNSQVFHLKAYAYLQSSNLKQAIENFDIALKISPHNCDIILDYSNLLNTINKKDLALNKLSFLTTINKADFRLYYLQGCIEMDLKKYDNAIKSYKKVLELKSDHKDASFNLGVIHFDIRKYDIAENIFITYLKSFGNDLEAQRYLLQLYLITSQIDKAEVLSKELCENNSKECMLWFERARILSRLNKNNDAIACYKESLKIAPDFNDAFKNMVILYKKDGLLDDYIEELKNNNDQESNNYTILTNLSQSLLINGKPNEAYKNIEKAINIHPKRNSNDKDYLNSLTIKGKILTALKEYKKSIMVFMDIIKIDDAIYQLYSDVADNFIKLNNIDEAISFYKKCLKINPNYATGHLNIGNAYFKLGEIKTALEYFNTSYEIDPNNSVTLSSLAAAYIEIKEPLKAIDFLKRAIQLDPLNGNAYLNLGIILLSQNLYDKAIKMFDQSISIYKQSSYRDELVSSGYKNKGLAHSALNEFDKMRDNFLEAIKFNKDTEFAYGFVCYSKLYCADWDKLDYYKNFALKYIEENKKPTTPFCSFSITDDPSIQLKVANQNCESAKINKKVPYVKENYLKNTKHIKPRVAYLSYDFHDHATMHLMAGVFEHQDHNKFDYYAFSYSDKSDDNSIVYNRVRKSFNNFHLVTEKKDNEICQMLEDNEIDIVVDLKGYTYKTRINLLAERPCPLQVTFLGHPGTTGASFIDYAIADNFIINKDNESYFSEKILKLPNCYQPTDNKRYFPNTKLSKKDLGLPESKFIFCSFNSPYKIQPEIFNIWMEILKSKEDSILWLLENEKSDSIKNIQARAQKKGIDPNRIIFSKRCLMNDYLDRLKVADLFLDTFPVTAHTTASDALWVGLPVLTLAGKSMVSRVAGSLLNNINMRDLITYNYDDYKKMALKLSNNNTYYTDIKSRLEKERLTSSLFDTKQYTKDLEDIYSYLYTNFKKSFN
jgi:protein O-GlcNAc transferase